MEAGQPLDDKYTTGIWYNGDIVEFEQYERDGDEVIIRSPDGEKLDTVECLETGSLQKVEPEAVENPVQYFNEIVNYLGYDGSMSTLPFREQISFDYAKENIKVVEK